MFHAFALALALDSAVPFTLVNNHINVDVMLNGKGPYRFIFDSGGSNLVDPAVAAEIGLTPHGSFRITGVGDGSQRGQFGTVDSLRLGPAEMKSQQFVITATRSGFGSTEGPPVDGLIGAEFLSQFVTTIDYEHRQMRFGEDPAVYSDGAQVLPVTLRSGHPRVPCLIDALPTICSIDTGSRLGVSVLKHFAAAHPDVVPGALTANAVEGYGVGGAAYGRLGRLQSLTFGNVSVENIVTDFSSQEIGAFSDSSIAANIGGNVLRRFTLTFDYPRSRIAFEPNALFALPDTFDRSGLFLNVQKGAITVLDVRGGTPAALAGIAKDDVIDSVNGRRYAPGELGDLRAFLSGPPGSAVLLELTDKTGATRSVRVVLQDYV
jgi:hypothetical protein